MTEAPRRDPALPKGGSMSDQPAPTTAREALALAWELAHPVKAGQIIPEDAEFIHLSPSGKYSHFKTRQGGDAVSAQHAHEFRTLDPLPEPEPDWLDAPAVIAFVKGRVGDRQVFVRLSDGRWAGRDGNWETWDLTDVTPLYPKGQNQ